jgi:hypothetical protein
MVKFFLQNFEAQSSTTTEPRITTTAKLEEEKWARVTWEANSTTVLPWV